MRRGAAALAVCAVLALPGCGGDDEPAEPATQAATPSATATPTAAASADGERVQLPAQRVDDLDKAVKAAGCTLQTDLADEGNDHSEDPRIAADYDTNPPTSGTHHPTWTDDGIYAPGDTPELGPLVHTLEHGRINVQYAAGSDPLTIAQLTAFVEEQDDGYHLLLYQNETDMPFAVAATAWRQLVGCEEFTPAVIDVLRAFYKEYVDKGPELVP